MPYYGIDGFTDDEVLAAARQIKDAGARWRKHLEASIDDTVKTLLKRRPGILRQVDRVEIMQHAEQVAKAWGEQL